MSLENPDDSTRCEACGIYVFLPVICSQCGRSFCEAHNSKHGDACDVTRQQRTVTDTSTVRTGISLDALVESVLEKERKEKEFIKAREKSENEANKNKNDEPSTVVALKSKMALAQQQQQRRVATLPLGLQRSRRLEVGRINRYYVAAHDQPCCSTVAVFFLLDDVDQSKTTAVPSSRRTREEDNADDDEKKITSHNSTVLLLRPIWLDLAFNKVSVGALIETTCALLAEKYLKPEESKRVQQDNDDDERDDGGIPWLVSDDNGGLLHPTPSQLRHMRSCFQQQMKEGFAASSVSTLTPNIKATQQNDSKQQITSSSCVSSQLTSLSYVVDKPAMVFVVNCCSTNDDNKNTQQLALTPHLEGLIWKKHSLWMLPFRESAPPPSSGSNDKKRDESSTKDDKTLVLSPAAEAQKQTSSTTTQQQELHVTPTALQNVPWAPDNSRAKPLSIGMSPQTGGSATAPAVLVVCFSGLTAGGTVAPDARGWTLRVNANFIVGRVIDALIATRGFVVAPSLAPYKDKLQIVHLSKKATGGSTSTSTSTSSSVLGLSVPFGKLVQPGDGIAIAPEGVEPDASLLLEAQTFADEMKRKTLPKPLMVRSMKECCIQ